MLKEHISSANLLALSVLNSLAMLILYQLHKTGKGLPYYFKRQ